MEAGEPTCRSVTHQNDQKFKTIHIKSTVIVTFCQEHSVVTTVQWAQHGAVMTSGQRSRRLNAGYGEPQDDWLSLSLTFVSSAPCCWLDAAASTSPAKINCGTVPDFEERIA